ncbi:MAG: hypothetical protein FWE44_01105 [Defluviitaleaceae bacterium]|nr:hypothetical protein [Defluviitaleaceae bacterium]
MIYWLMLAATIGMAVSSFFTYREYVAGKVGRQIFTKMRFATILIIILYAIILLSDFVIVNQL